MSVSLTSSEPASTIIRLSRVPAMTRLMSLPSSSWKVGFTRNSPSMRPTRAPAIGPANGMSEMASAADAPIIAGMSESLTRSWETT